MILNKRPAKTRADKLRNKREKQQHLAKSRASVISRNMAAKPTVVSRTNIGMPVFERTRTTVKKKYSFAIDKVGTELIVPGLPILKIGWRLLSGILLVFLSLYLVAFIKMPNFVVQNIETSGLSAYEINDFENILQVNGKFVYEIDPQVLEAKLTETYPEIMGLNVIINFPSQVLITGIQRTPVVEWKNGDTSLWIDKDRNIFPSRGKADTVIMVNSSNDPPLSFEDSFLMDLNSDKKNDEEKDIEQSLTNKRVDKLLFDAVVRIGTQMPENFVISYDSRTGIGWNDPRGWYVSFGNDLENLDEKLMVYETVLKEFIAKNIQPSFISVENLHAPYYRME